MSYSFIVDLRRLLGSIVVFISILPASLKSFMNRPLVNSLSKFCSVFLLLLLSMTSSSAGI